MCLPAAANNASAVNYENGFDNPATGGGGVPVAAPARSTTDMLANIGLGLQGAGAVTGAFGAYTQSKSNQRALEQQAVIAEYQAKNAMQRGAQTMFKRGVEKGQLQGSQRAALAARGLSLDEGSALNLLLDSEYMSNVDDATVKANTDNEVWSHRSNAGQLRARAADERPTMAAATTLLTGAGGVAKSWYALRNKREVA